MVALIFAILGLAINTFSALMVKELPDEEGMAQGENEQKADKPGLITALKLLVKNPYYLIIVGLYILYYGGNGISSASSVYFYNYYFENPALMGIMSLSGTLPMILILAITPVLVKKAGSIRKVTMLGYLLSSVAGILQIFAAMQKSIPLFFILAVVRSLGMGPFTGTINALIAETADYTRKSTGISVDGTMFSCSSIGVKVGGGIGSAIAGILLSVGGFDGMAEVQTAGAVNMIFFMTTVLPVVIGLGIVVLLYFLKVEKANAELDLAQKKEAAAC